MSNSTRTDHADDTWQDKTDGSSDIDCSSAAIALHRRSVLRTLVALGATPLAGCGGVSSDGSTSTSTSSSGTTTTACSSDPWVWATTGSSTTATVPTIADLVQVIASGTVTYAFHASATSSSTDPLTVVTTDTSSTATLVPCHMGKYLVTNANWKAFCNAMGDSY